MKKILMFLAVFTMLLVLAACGNTVECGPGTILEDGVCIADLADPVKVINLSADKSLSFEIGDTLPDFTTYFEKNDVTIDLSMITHDIMLDTNNIMTTAGTYTVTVVVEDVTKEFTVTVTAEEIETIAAGIYLNEGYLLVFEVGDTLPNFLEYFTATDGTNIIEIPIGNILHTLLLDATNIMTTTGTYSVQVTVGSFNETFAITVVAEGEGQVVVEIPEIAGIYLVADTKVNFVVGDTFPGFASYFKVSDGTSLLAIDGNNVLHNILMNDNNIMTTAGTYTVSYTHYIGMTEYYLEFIITVS